MTVSFTIAVGLRTFGSSLPKICRFAGMSREDSGALCCGAD
jgi:hypothetical protein